MKEHPIAMFKDALSRAEKSGIELPNAFTLATATPDGKPSARMLLLKGADERGFVFYTNLTSRKCDELEQNPHAAACFWWPPLEEQIRIEGTVERVSDAEADEYFATRPRGSQLGAWASKQSHPLPSYEVLLDAVEAAAKRFTDRNVERPPFWSGYRLRPERIEFWHGTLNRLHERYLYTRKGEAWEMTLLSP